MFREVLKIVFVAWLISVPLKHYVFQTFQVQGASMEEEIKDKDRLLIEEISYRFRMPERGDIIVFRAPNNQVQFFVKRVVGLPGETVEILNGDVIVSNFQNPKGFVLDESEYLDAGQITYGSIKSSMGENEFFVLGDNRLYSSDSRLWGPVDRDLITGRVLSRAWPLRDMTIFHSPDYQ